MPRTPQKTSRRKPRPSDKLPNISFKTQEETFTAFNEYCQHHHVTKSLVLNHILTEYLKPRLEDPDKKPFY